MTVFRVGGAPEAADGVWSGLGAITLVPFRCPACGYTVSDASAACPSCHTPFARRAGTDGGVLSPGSPLPPPTTNVPSSMRPLPPAEWYALFGGGDAPKKSRTALTLTVSGIAAVIVLVAAVAFVVVRDRTAAASYPRSWDPRVAAIAEFVQRDRGLTFKHPVTVEFLTAAQYREAALGGADEPDTAVITEDDFVAQFRAVGLISGAVDVQAAGATLADSGTLAFYSPIDKRVRVRDTGMTPGLRVTLAHELTHALQDQYFDLAAERPAAPSTFRAIVEGDAVRIERAYATTMLTDAESDEKARSDQAAQEEYVGALASSDVPGVLSTVFELPYAVGPQLVEIAAAQGGDAAVDALLGDPPASEVALLDPLNRGIDTTAAAEAPLLPAGAEVLDRSPMGAGLLFLLIGERVEPAAAFDAAVTWTAEASVISRQDGRICFDADFRTDGSGLLAAAMTTWSVAMPRGSDTTVTGDDADVRVHTCDPGIAANFVVPARTEQTLTYVAIRTEIELELLRDAHMTAAQSLCIAARASRTISAADLAADGYDATADTELIAALQQAVATC